MSFPTNEQSIVILGAGVIGLSTAYYLATSSQSPLTIHVLDSSPTLFQCASGRAAGFIAKDWFAPATSELGALSFQLHKNLAERFDGKRNWGYSGSIGISLTESKDEAIADSEKDSGWEDWLFGGQSRRTAVEESLAPETTYAWPEWLKNGDGHLISTDNSTAQVDPQRFCEFLLQKCLEHNVIVKNSATATNISVDPGVGGLTSLSYLTGEGSEVTIPCTSVLLAAGPWTAKVYMNLFPDSELKIPVSNLAGWSVVLRSPVSSATEEAKLTSLASCHAVFTTSSLENFSPEIFSRILPLSTREEQGGKVAVSSRYDIYLAGLNSSELPLPNVATEVDPTPGLDDPHILSLLKVARQLILPQMNAKGNNNDTDADLEVIRTGLCHRPVTTNHRPILTRIDPKHYAPGVVLQGGEQGTRGLYVCAGHGPWGISMSLGSGKICADLMMGRQTPSYLKKMSL